MTLRAIALDLCEQRGCGILDLQRPGRFEPIVFYRQEFMWLAHRTGYSQCRIAAFLGMDHKTVHHGVKAHQGRLDVTNS